MDAALYRSFIVASFAAMAMVTAACGGTSATISSVDPTAALTSDPAPTTPTTQLVGGGCRAYDTWSRSANTTDPSTESLAGTLSNNLSLSTFSKALSGQLNERVDADALLDRPHAHFTVFAPLNSAFAKLPASRLTALSRTSGAAGLSALVDYHLIRRQLDPNQLDGVHTTVAGKTLTVRGRGDAITINGSSAVICGGIHTANATVYLIDTVLSPPFGGMAGG